MMRNEENNMTNFKMTANMRRALAMATMHMDRADRPANYKGQPVTVANSSYGRNYEGHRELFVHVSQWIRRRDPILFVLLSIKERNNNANSNHAAH
jgi:hypothetical protein